MSSTVFRTPGSSPRVRGKLIHALALLVEAGLIPARAGKTDSQKGETSCSRAHPRACGENMGEQIRRLGLDGSSPRVRGKRGPGRDPRLAAGLIPARAGKTASWTYRPGTSRAHPRACGENPTESPAPTQTTGSSPRVRGKPRRDDEQGVRVGLIPARAGKTGVLMVVISFSAAHPRACGENAVSTALTTRGSGSSPRVRGKLDVGDVQPPRGGLIPARAGKTRRSGAACWRWRAHPRACGENGSRSDTGQSGRGSSPRVRGKHSYPRGQRDRYRLIPARAGKTPRARTTN